MKYCLIGEKLGHSYSAVIHRSRGYDYDLCPIEKGKLEEFCKKSEYDGFNVTIPYKKDIIPYLDELSERAKAVGAVNTVTRKDGKLYGDNTDIGGLEYMISSKGVSLKNKHVLILGSGGASATAVALSHEKGAKSVTVVSRSGEVNYVNCKSVAGNAQIIINATPVGMYPNTEATPITLDGFDRLEAVFDCIYNPFTTELLCEARSKNLISSHGLPMLVEQALIAEDIWSGGAHTREESEETLALVFAKMANIVLFGMPSSGKSTLGKLIADKLKKEFVDTDEEITKKYGKKPSEIINESGEQAFRNMESEVVKEVAKLSGRVISLGGGAVLRGENVRALRANGILCYIKRPLSLLTTEDRPLSQREGIEKLFEARKDIYEEAKDYSVNNDKKIEKAVKEIIKGYETACNKRC